MRHSLRALLYRALLLAACLRGAYAADAQIRLDAGHPGAAVSPDLYGIFFEEINHAGDGGLYAELIRNRGFEDANLPPACVRKGNRLIPPRTPHFWTQPKPSNWTMDWNPDSPWPGWSLVTSGAASAQLALTTDNPLTPATPHSLRAHIDHLPAKDQVSLVNEGYWGMNIVRGEQYRLSFWARTDALFHGPFRVSLRGGDRSNLAAAILPVQHERGWQKYEAVLTATGTEPKATFHLSFGSIGTVWLDFVSLFPVKTFHNRPNGMREDIAQMIAGLRPAFIRFPGGCYAEGITIQSRPQWKTSLGRLEDRVPTYSPWGYWSTNGLGYHEFLQFAEDLGANALYVVNAGISCAFRSGTFIPDNQLQPLIDDTLDAIEYAIGPVDSKWGSVRAKAGHPAPFPLKYIEIGNEDQGAQYGARFARFYRAIKTKYPQLTVVLDSWIADIDWQAIKAAGKFDILDEHSYRPLYWSFTNFDHFAQYKRGLFDLYIGEFATNSGVGRGNLAAALDDAAFMMSMEANADLVRMGSYAPLLENVNKPDWEVNLIHYDSSRIFGRASYYMCRLFAENRPDFVLPTYVTYRTDKLHPIAGQVGLGTYDTAADFKDIHIESDGRTVYESHFGENTARGWDPKPGSGHWAVSEGVFRQSQEAVAWAYFHETGWRDVTVSLKARKRSGREGFVVVLGEADGRRIAWNVGGFGNHLHAVEADDTIIGTPVKASVKSGKWYDVKVEVRGREIRCYLDGELISNVRVPEVETVLAVAGKDSKKGEIVVKALNTSSEPAHTGLVIDGNLCVATQGRLTQLTSARSTDENSFEEPRRIAPTVRTVNGLARNFALDLPPRSFSILRLGTASRAGCMSR